MTCPQRWRVTRVRFSTFNRMLNSGLLMHDGNPELRASVLAATSKDSEAGWRYVMSPRAAGRSPWPRPAPGDSP